jgi:flagellar motor switch protein FliG
MNATTKQNGIRKAAILVSVLSPAAAGRLLAQVPPEQAEEVRRVQSVMGTVDPQEQRAVLEEFFHLAPEPAVELDESLARKIAAGHGERAPQRTPHAPREGAGRAEPEDVRHAERETARHAERDEYKTPPFRFLQQAEGDKLVKILSNERPQTIALVLAHLPPQQAGAVLVRFEPAAQVEIIRRLVDLEETHPEILREVGHALEVRLSEQVQMQRRRVAGLAAVEGILEASSGQDRAQIFENLAALDRPLADKLGPERLEFSELVYQDQQTLAVLLTAAGRELWMLAMVGAPPALLQRVLQLLPPAEAQAFRHHLDHLGPTRLSDVEESRRRIEDLARRLVVQRRITFARRARPAYARS